MKALKIGLLGVALLAITVGAKAEGERPEKPLSSEAKMKSQVFNRISDIRINDFELEDETVDIYFQLNENGEVLVDRVDGASCAVSEVVSNKLNDKKMFVESSLQNTTHHIKVRYVVAK